MIGSLGATGTISTAEGHSVGLLDGQVALVTGAARGIGAGVARRFAAEGAAVMLGDVDVDGCDAVAAEIGRSGGRALGHRLDVTAVDSLEAVRDAAERAFGTVDVVVANAGVFLYADTLDTTREQWQRVLDINLTGAFLTCQVFGRALRERDQGGRLILTSSLYGVRSGRGNAAYSASKFGVLGLMQALAAEFAEVGVTVNAVCPGQVDTEMMTAVFQGLAAQSGTSAADQRAALEAGVPLGRLASVEELADVFVYLASPLSRYVTGQAHVVDGGWQVG